MTGQNPEDVPGTILIWDAEHDESNIQRADGGQIVLQPQPSDDPEDPLNWAPGRKRIAISMTYIYTFGIGIATTVTYSIMTQVSSILFRLPHSLNTNICGPP